MEIKLKTDSRKVQAGDTFIAIRNVERDGHDYIDKAIENGATTIICEEGSYPVETVIVEDTRKYLNDYLYTNYYPVIKDMNFVGVTGTNGKTTICYMMYQMMRLLNKKVAYMGTIGFYYNDKFLPMVNTTPDVDKLYEMLLLAKEDGCQTIVMEVSSHALAKDRIHGLEFDEVAFTNLTQDHLDYHKTLENYADAKKILFSKTRNNRIAVINGDDPWANHFIIDSNKNLVISNTLGDLIINDIEYSHLGTKINFTYKDTNYNTSINMVGSYNVYNYLTALLLIEGLGINLEDVLAIHDKVLAPAGRMELIKYKNNSVFVDFAHTPVAMENVLKTAHQFKVGKIITIFGCGGDRDPMKRPLMGDIATKNSDYVIITNDNPRNEDPDNIIKDILKGLSKDNYEVIQDRATAIKRGMDLLEDNDILMLLGKGHENYNITKEGKSHFSDREEVEKYIGDN